MGKESLPSRRYSESFDMDHSGLQFAVQAGYYPDGRLGEVFISSPKTGSMAEINARDASILLSKLLQRGADPQETLDALTHDMDGKPEGVVGKVLEVLVEEEAQ